MGAEKDTNKDAVQALAEDLLCKNWVESRAAIQGRERVEIFRGKDLLLYLREHADLVERALPGQKGEESVKELATLFMKRGFFCRSERLYKKPKPGRQKLTKFPRKVFVTEDQTFVEGGFYTWKIERPPTPWVYLGSYVAVLLVIGMCLFPLAPYSVKLGVFYTSLTSLTCILGIVGVRVLVYCAIWTALGKYVWIIPNLFADNVPLTEIFVPFFEEEKNKYGKPFPAPPATKRLAAFGVLLLALLGAYRNTPEKGYGAKFRSSSDELFDFLVAQSSLQRIDGAAGSAGQGGPVEGGAEAEGGDPMPESGDGATFAETPDATVFEEAAQSDGASAHTEL